MAVHRGGICRNGQIVRTSDTRSPFMITLRTILFFMLSVVSGSAPIRATMVDGTLDVYWVDVEGGAATLIVTPAGESVLIDSGRPGGRDPGRIHQVATEVAGLTRIDHYVTTHFHADHFGGAAELSRLMPIGQVHDNGIPAGHPDGRPNDPRWPLLIRPYREMEVEGRSVVGPGIEIPLAQVEGAPRLSMLCVAARQEYIDPPAGAAPNSLTGQVTRKEIDPTDNENSNAWVLSFGGFRFFDGGDLTWNNEATLVTPVNRVGQVDVYQVDHHGRDDSNNPVLIHSLAPTVSIMNNGITKGTAASTINGLRSSPGLQAMYQVHKNLRPGDPENNTADELIANHDDDPNTCAANTITMTVAADGASYTVAIPASGHRKTFQVRNQGNGF